MTDYEQDVQSHYGGGGLVQRVLAALKEAGKDPGNLKPDDLSPVDEFHTRGRAATSELAAFGGLRAGMEVLDVGSGLGGPSRYLASVIGCKVTGLELTETFRDAADRFSAWVGLSEQTRFHQGSALEMPFGEGSFDAAWTIQAQMNIADKERFYGEIHRVLKPGGLFVFQDIFAGNGEPLDFPVPWATHSGLSHLLSWRELEPLLVSRGFRIGSIRDVSADTIAFGQAHASPADQPLPTLGIHLVLGERIVSMRKNSSAALRDGRIVFLQGVCTKAM